MYVNEMDVRLLLQQVGDLIRSEPDRDQRRLLLATLRQTSDTIARDIRASLRGTSPTAKRVPLDPEVRLARQRARAEAARAKRFAKFDELENAVKIELRWLDEGGVGTVFWKTLRATHDMEAAYAAKAAYLAKWHHNRGSPAGRNRSPDRPEDRPP